MDFDGELGDGSQGRQVGEQSAPFYGHLAPVTGVQAFPDHVQRHLAAPGAVFPEFAQFGVNIERRGQVDFRGQVDWDRNIS